MAKAIYHPYDLFIVGELGDANTLEFQIALRDAHQEVDDAYPLRINICCEGSGLEHSLAIVSQVHEYRRQGRKIITHCSSGAYSGGMTILQAGTERTMDEFATLMIHTTQLEIDHWNGTNDQMEEFVKNNDLIGMKVIDVISHRTGLDKAWIDTNMFGGGDNYFNAITALELNFVDSIIYPPA
jgi:ATP-dependent protease ClpP protease subunit